jgi:hypothetical protein
MIRPSDPEVTTPTLAFMPVGSAEAVRRIMDLAYRDCHSVLDLTWGGGARGGPPPPPDVVITTNNLDPLSGSNLHRDFRHTGLPDRHHDLVIYDPPHLADGGTRGVMASRYATVKGGRALRDLVYAGAREAARVARVGVLAKVADHAHGGRWLDLSAWVVEAIHLHSLHSLYFVLHTYRAPLVDPKWKVQRVPRSNGATYLAFRFGDGKHVDFERLYARQERAKETACPTPRSPTGPS